MSSAALAKKRRANMQANTVPTPPPPVQPTAASTTTTGSVPQRQMTLPQVLQLVDSRLLKLETIAKEQMEKQPETVETPVIDDSWKQILPEYESRFEMLLTEINDLKDVVMKLQSYTMDVNKTLLEERVHYMATDSHNSKDFMTMEVKHVEGDIPIDESYTPEEEDVAVVTEETAEEITQDNVEETKESEPESENIVATTSGHSNNKKKKHKK
jgi:hypothetical protein